MIVVKCNGWCEFGLVSATPGGCRAGLRTQARTEISETRLGELLAYGHLQKIQAYMGCSLSRDVNSRRLTENLPGSRPVNLAITAGNAADEMGSMVYCAAQFRSKHVSRGSYNRRSPHNNIAGRFTYTTRHSRLPRRACRGHLIHHRPTVAVQCAGYARFSLGLRRDDRKF
jgi:hypothetical protein